MTQRAAKCMKCDALAVWELAPADSYGEYCDDCVPRGCSCNREFNPKTNHWDGPQRRDERGRLLPCCEYSWEPEGFTPSPPDKVEQHRKQMEPYLAKLRAEGKIP